MRPVLEHLDKDSRVEQATSLTKLAAVVAALAL
jgi:hypothetical protein